MKRKSHTDHLFTILFAFATIYLALYADFNGHITNLLKSHGFNSPEFSSLIAGSLITLFATIAVFLYEKCFWKLWFKASYRGGWWLYGLVDDEADPAKPEERGANPIVGFFQIKHSLDKIEIKNASCFYYDSSNINNHIAKARGFWDSNVIMCTDDEIRLVYDMAKIEYPQNGKGFMPSTRYMGYMELKNHEDDETVTFGKNPYYGLVIQISLEHDHGGVMYCERLKTNFLNGWNPKTLKKILHIEAKSLVERAIDRRNSKPTNKEI
jgi:hypothetical protein